MVRRLTVVWRLSNRHDALLVILCLPRSLLSCVMLLMPLLHLVEVLLMILQRVLVLLVAHGMSMCVVVRLVRIGAFCSTMWRSI